MNQTVKKKLIHLKPNILSESGKREKENLLGPIVYHEHVRLETVYLAETENFLQKVL